MANRSKPPYSGSNVTQISLPSNVTTVGGTPGPINKVYPIKATDLDLTGLPTDLPADVGVLWDDAGAVSISQPDPPP
jgi:hypothetical protein